MTTSVKATKNLISKFLILFGLICLVFFGYFFWQRNNPQKLAFNYSEAIASEQTSIAERKPVQITMPDLNIDLPVYPAVIKKNRWEATTKGVSYLTSSSTPGDEGNSILYGHNWPNRLGNLKNAKPGQVIQITFNDKIVKTFIVEYTSVVTPDQTQILAQTKDKRITLYTCIGFLDSKRFVVVALLK